MVAFINVPDCNMTECFANNEKRCVILTKKEFGARKCPFFKTEEQVEEEKAYCEKRLAEIRKENEHA